jgi:hypothetical protein
VTNVTFCYLYALGNANKCRKSLHASVLNANKIEARQILKPIKGRKKCRFFTDFLDLEK